MIRYFATHPTAANLLMIAFLVLGLSALPNLQRDTFPVIPPTEVEIRISYPGAGAEDVEEAVCLRIEEAVEAIADLQEVRCDARDNLAIGTAQMREGADYGDFFNDVQSQIDGITGFPANVERATVTKLERVATIAGIAITGEDIPPRSLKAYAEQVKMRFDKDGRIAQTTLKGFSDQDILIEVSQETLRRYGLNATDITATIERQSLDLPSGVMQTPDGDYSARVKEARATPSDFADLVVITGAAGGQVRLGDIAKIRFVFDAPENRIEFNGQRAALLEIAKTTQQDALRVMDAVHENLARERKLAPPKIKLTISQDSTANIRDRLRIVMDNGLQGLVLVFLTMWVFFSLRFSFWVAMGLPVSFLGAVFAMQFLGYTLNMMTMVALLVATGLLMDDAIIIAENIAAKVRQGKKGMEAAVEGVRQVMPGVISSFVTTVMVVAPLAVMAGKMGAVLRYIPAVLVITLTISLFEAFFILPAHVAHSLHGVEGDNRSRFHKWFDRRFDGLRDNWFRPFQAWTLRQSYLTVGVILGLILFSYATLPAGWLKYQAFPTLESDVIQARVLLPQGTPLSRTEAVVEDLTSALKQLDEEFSERQQKGKRLVRNITALYNVNVDAYEAGPHIATVSADLLRAEERNGTIEEMLNRWRELTGSPTDVIALKFTDKERGVAGKAVEIRLQSGNLMHLKKASQALQKWLESFKGVHDISDDLRPGKPELLIRMKDNAGSLGISSKTVAEEARAAIHGATGMEIRRGPETYDVTVRLAQKDLKSPDDLTHLMVRAANGTLIPMTAVADIDVTEGYARLHRINGQRTVTVEGKVDTTVANARNIMQMTKKVFLPKLREQFPTVRPAFKGQGAETAATGASLQTNIAIGLIGVFLILAYQFRSYIQPVVVLLAIPLGFVGVVWGHLAMGLNLTMPSLIGFATLAGVVVNDSILLVAFMRERIAAGMPVLQAGNLAATDRFRAIVLTSLTTIAGLTPLLSETSTQAQVLIPLVAALAFGLFSATMLSLFFVPAFYVVLADMDFLKIAPQPDRGELGG